MPRRPAATGTPASPAQPAPTNPTAPTTVVGWLLKSRFTGDVRLLVPEGNVDANEYLLEQNEVLAYAMSDGSMAWTARAARAARTAWPPIQNSAV